MAQSKITLIGFYNYYKAVDKDLFANLTLPAGISKDDVINNIEVNKIYLPNIKTNTKTYQDVFEYVFE